MTPRYYHTTLLGGKDSDLYSALVAAFRDAVRAVARPGTEG